MDKMTSSPLEKRAANFLEESFLAGFDSFDAFIAQLSKADRERLIELLLSHMKNDGDWNLPDYSKSCSILANSFLRSAADKDKILV